MKSAITILLLFVSCLARAQYIPNSALNYHYASIYNPAFTGVEDYTEIKGGFRYQWAAFKGNAPQFGNLNVNLRLKRPLDLKQNALRPSRSNFDDFVPRGKMKVHGLGFNVYNETIGPMKSVGGGAHYSLHIPISKKSKLAMGFGGMIQNTKVDSDLYWGVNVDVTDPIYEKITAAGARQTEIWTRAGLLFYTPTFYVGATYYTWNNTLASSDIAFLSAYYRGGAQAGVTIPLSEDFVLKPSVWALVLNTNDLVVDYTAKFFLHERTWFGLTYRDVKSGVVSGGFEINEFFSAAYAYEFSLGRLRTFGGGSHEIVLAFRMRNLKEVKQWAW